METVSRDSVVHSVLQVVPLFAALPSERSSADYDREADVLHISFQRPQKATQTVMTDDGLLLRYRGDQLVGVTVLNASARANMPSEAATAS